MKSPLSPFSVYALVSLHSIAANPIDMGDHRELFVDETLIESMTDVEFVAPPPIPATANSQTSELNRSEAESKRREDSRRQIDCREAASRVERTQHQKAISWQSVGMLGWLLSTASNESGMLRLALPIDLW